MEDLFSTNITVNNKSTKYRVIFDDERYDFKPDGDDSSSIFSFKREHDKWISQEPVSKEISEQALDALDQYLLKQH